MNKEAGLPHGWLSRSIGWFSLTLCELFSFDDCAVLELVFGFSVFRSIFESKNVMIM